MSIIDNWGNLNPKKHNIKVFTGHVWEVVGKVPDSPVPAFVVKCPGYSPERFSLVNEKGTGQQVIINEDLEKDVYLNHPDTEIVSK